MQLRKRFVYVLLNQSTLAVGAVLVSIIYEANLDKQDFGLYSSILVWVSFLTMVCSSPLTGAAGIIIKKQEDDIGNFIDKMIIIRDMRGNK